MQRQKIILDVDPGVDDSIAMIYSFLCKGLDIKLIGVVGGNVSSKQCTRNALYITENFAQYKIPIVEGFGEPILVPFSHNLSVHGKKGLGDKIVATGTKLKTINRKNYGVCEAYRDTIYQNTEEIVIICAGPSTNLAHTIKKYPEIVNMVKEVIIMGGSVDGTGSITPYAGFNVYYDPEALSIILKAGFKKISFSPKEIGLSTFVNDKFTSKLEKYNRFGQMVKNLYCGYHDLLLPTDRYATHDLCAVMSLAKPKIFKRMPVKVKLQLGKGKKRGQTLFAKDPSSNIFLIYAANRKKVLKEFEKTIKSAE